MRYKFCYSPKKSAWQYFTITAYLTIAVLCSSCAKEPIPINIPDYIVQGKIISIPSDANVTINAHSIGMTPTSYSFNFTDQYNYSILVEKADYLSEEIDINSDQLVDSNGVIHVSLSLHPLISSTSDSLPANHWISVNMRPELMEKQAWDKFIKLLKGRTYKISTMNGTNGSLVTSFKNNSFLVHNETVHLRSRLETKFTGEYPKLLMSLFLRTEKSADGHQWVPYNRIVKKDAQTFRSIKKQFAVRRP